MQKRTVRPVGFLLPSDGGKRRPYGLPLAPARRGARAYHVVAGDRGRSALAASLALQRSGRYVWEVQPPANPTAPELNRYMDQPHANPVTFSEQVREVAAENERLHPQDEGFLDQLKQAAEGLDQFDNERELVLHKQLSPDQLGNDRNEVFLNLLRNQRGWLDFFIHTHVYKVEQLVRRLEKDLNANEYLTAASASRAIVEHTASLNYYLERHILPLFKKLQDTDPEMNFPVFVKRTVELIRSLMKYAKATRFNWKSFVEGDLEKFYKSWDEVDESIEQVNILTMVEKLPQDERGARFFYEMLSDFLHPNAGSHLLFVDDVSQSEDTVKYTLRSEPRSDELLLAFLHVVSIPVKTSLPLFIDLVGGLSDNLRELENTIDRIEKRSRSI